MTVKITTAGRARKATWQTLVQFDLFKKALLECLEETFEHVNGIYLDKNTSMFETLDRVSAEDASRSIAEGAAANRTGVIRTKVRLGRSIY
jgi:hypothetical protein